MGSWISPCSNGLAPRFEHSRYVAQRTFLQPEPDRPSYHPSFRVQQQQDSFWPRSERRRVRNRLSRDAPNFVVDYA